MAQKYKFGNKIWANKEGSTLAYNDENDNYKPLPFTFTRDSIATRVNKEGLIEVVVNNKPRVDYYDSSKGVLLLEPQRTNLVPYSENFDTYTQYGSPTITYNDIISPDGLMNGIKVQRGSNATPIRVSSITTLGTEYTMSIWAKAGDTDQINLDIGDELNATFNLTSEWKRFDVTSTPSQYTHIDITIPDSSDGEYIYIYGLQLEAGSYPTSYIPTNGSTVQREAEVANGSGNSEVFNDSEGVLFADISGFSNYDANSIISISDGSVSDRLLLYYGTTTNTINVFNGTNVGTYTSNDIKLFNKVSLVYDSTSTRMWVNGFEVLSISSVDFNGLNVLNFQNETNILPFYGKTKEIGYYDTALTDAELETLTSYRSLSEMVTELNLNTL